MNGSGRHFGGESRESIRAEVDDELRFHLESRTEALMARGLTREEARGRALQEFGDIADARDSMARFGQRVHTVRRRRSYVGDFRRDISYSVRRLRSAPAFAVTAVLTLALGIGANTAIFSLVYGVLLRPLPFPDPDRLYAVYTANRTAGMLEASVSAVDLDDWRASRSAIEDLGGFFFADGTSGVDLTGRGSPQRLSAVFITPGFLTALGVQPFAGRLPREDEMVRGGRDKVVMLTHGFWMREFGGDPSVVGTSISLGGEPYDVLGVLPPQLRYPAEFADVFVPFSTIPDSGIPRIRPVRALRVVARAKPGVTEDGVRAEMMTITARLAAEYPENRSWDAATVRPLADVISGPVRPGLLVLLGAVGLVLLMACVNVAGLQLARAMGRGREVAVRLALGARRGRLVRQLLTESLVLSVAGGVAGLLLAKGGLAGLIALASGQLPRAAEVELDVVMIGFAMGLSIVTGLAFGLVPAWRTSRGDAHLAFRDGGRSIAGQGHQRIRSTLVIAEVAVAMMLVVGAGLMGRSFLALTRVDAGFQPDHLLAVQFTIDAERHSSPAAPPAPAAVSGRSHYTGYYQQVIDRVRALPGVLSAAAVKDAPFRGNGELNSFRIPDRPVPAGEQAPLATVIHVSDGYFKTIGARVDGREFTRDDRAGAPPVVVVNDAFARRHFPGERAVGKSLRFGQSPVEIVGVVNDIRQVSMAEPAAPTIYLHNLQNGRVKTTIVARTAGDPMALAPAVRAAIWEIDPLQAITTVFTFDEAVGRSLARSRLLAVLLGSFGALGLLLGAVGVYGVLASLVTERRREIGVRLALGARPEMVRRLVVRRGLGLALAGIAIGLAGAFGLSRYLDAVLFGVGPADPITFGGTAAVLLAAALAASWMPAYRASRLDPVETLRTE